MTTFPQPDPDPGTATEHRDTSHIRAGGHATPAPGSARGFPPGPVPAASGIHSGDAQPKQDSDRPLPTSEQPGAPGKAPVPTN